MTLADALDAVLGIAGLIYLGFNLLEIRRDRQRNARITRNLSKPVHKSDRQKLR